MDLDIPVVGKDGIVIDKAADSEKIEISGNNFVKKDKSATGYQRVYAVSEDGNEDIRIRVDYSNDATGQSIIRRDSYGSIYVPNASIGRTDYNFSAGQEAVNKKYVDDAIANIGGGGGGKLYKHCINLMSSDSAKSADINIINSRGTAYPINTPADIDVIFNEEIGKYFISGYVIDNNAPVLEVTTESYGQYLRCFVINDSDRFLTLQCCMGDTVTEL